MHDNTHELKMLMRDASTGFYHIQRYRIGDFFGPVDLGIPLAFRQNALTIGAGLLPAVLPPGRHLSILSQLHSLKENTLQIQINTGQNIDVHETRIAEISGIVESARVS